MEELGQRCHHYTSRTTWECVLLLHLCSPPLSAHLISEAKALLGRLGPVKDQRSGEPQSEKPPKLPETIPKHPGFGQVAEFLQKLLELLHLPREFVYM